jgi:hypothetical protein
MDAWAINISFNLFLKVSNVFESSKFAFLRLWAT